MSFKDKTNVFFSRLDTLESIDLGMVFFDQDLSSSVCSKTFRQKDSNLNTFLPDNETFADLSYMKVVLSCIPFVHFVAFCVMKKSIVSNKYQPNLS